MTRKDQIDDDDAKAKNHLFHIAENFDILFLLDFISPQNFIWTLRVELIVE